MMGNYYGGMGGFGFGFGWIFTLLFWGLIIWAIFAVVRSVSGRKCCGGRGHCGRGGSCEHEGGKALDILKERYAKGEINKEDFENMKKDVEI